MTVVCASRSSTPDPESRPRTPNESSSGSTSKTRVGRLPARASASQSRPSTQMRWEDAWNLPIRASPERASCCGCTRQLARRWSRASGPRGTTRTGARAEQTRMRLELEPCPRRRLRQHACRDTARPQMRGSGLFRRAAVQNGRWWSFPRALRDRALGALRSLTGGGAGRRCRLRCERGVLDLRDDS